MRWHRAPVSLALDLQREKDAAQAKQKAEALAERQREMDTSLGILEAEIALMETRIARKGGA